MYRVDKGKRIPDARKGVKYPWDRMGDGDSFFVPLEGGKKLTQLRSTITASAGQWLERNPEPRRKVVTRTVEEDGVLGVRVWMVHLDPTPTPTPSGRNGEITVRRRVNR